MIETNIVGKRMGDRKSKNERAICTEIKNDRERERDTSVAIRIIKEKEKNTTRHIALND